MSALAQRQWRQRAQTAVRVAMTSSKEARSKFKALSDAGDAALSDLANSLLELSHLPALKLPQPLAAMKPDIRAAAAAKLVRQQAGMLEDLQSRLEQMGASVAALRRAVESLDEVQQEEPWMRASAIFHTMPLARVRQLLNKVYDMYAKEFDSKAAVVSAFAGLAAAPAAAADTAAAEAATAALEGGSEGVLWGGKGAGDVRGTAVVAEVSRQNAGGGDKRLPDLCTTYVSVWMLSPYLEEEQADEALGAIDEDMVSF